MQKSKLRVKIQNWLTRIRESRRKLYVIVISLLVISLIIYFIVFPCKFSFMISYLDTNQGLLTALLTIFGWIAVFWLGLRQQKINLNNEAKMRIYAELYEYRKQLSKASNELAVSLFTTSPPFILMKSTDIGNESIKAKQEAANYWREFVNGLFNRKQEFVDTYINFWIHIEMWLGLMPELEEAKDILFNECNRVNERISKYHQFLQSCSVEEYDWHKWNINRIQKNAEGLYEDFSNVADGYVEDFMGLIHNSLVTPIFNYRRNVRNVKHIKRRIKFPILTKNGIIEYEHIPNIYEN